MKDIKKYTANYANTNHNFVIQNLDDEPNSNSQYYSAICVVKNILQRGKPTLMSSFLQKQIGKIHEFDEFKKNKVLIDSKLNSWNTLIKGCKDKEFNPAKAFFDEKLDLILGKECKFVRNLLLPEVLISEITQENKKEFKDQQVDFYLPQAYLVIEIDGSQHLKDSVQKNLDMQRDKYLNQHGIKVFRINAKDIYNNSFDKIKNELCDYIKKHKVLTLYKNAYNNNFNLDDPILKATTIIRYQILLLELLKYDKISLDSSQWQFELFDNNENSKLLLELAIQDLFIWFACILKLQNIPFKKPKVQIDLVNSLEDFSHKPNIKIDFSLFKRFSDINQKYPDVFFVRTDYIDTYKVFKNQNSSTIEKVKIEPVDYFEIEIADLVKYKFNKKYEKIHNKILKYLVWNIFLQVDKTLTYHSFDFREGQLSIIKNILERNDTIGLLPTGCGKSICYQIAAILQPAPSFVVAPIISLMNDQVDELNRFYFTRVAQINSNQTSNEKREVLQNFANKKYICIFISPERFQVRDFKIKLRGLPKLSYAVVDEAHCLSEWGHDFRTSYLTLVKTIRNCCNNDISFVALTATASLSVLKDLKLAFDINDDANVKTPLDYSREELEFFVTDVSDRNANYYLQQAITEINDDKENFATLIFTPYASGYDYGCKGVAEKLSKSFPDEDIKYYSGQLEDKEKIDIQNAYKNDEFKILIATKAFGMGVNKGNIKYTFHYGIPSSLEALYQEAGRAGRAKKLFNKSKAKCYILFDKETKKSLLQKVWNIETSRDELKSLCAKRKTPKHSPKVPDFEQYLSHDVKRQLYFLQDNFEPIKDQLRAVKEIYDYLQKSTDKIIYCDNLENLKKVEKYLYRLYQLNIVDDWTINYNSNSLEVLCNNITSDDIKLAFQNQIQKYDPKFSFEIIAEDKEYKKYFEILEDNLDPIDKYIKIILEWSFDKFVGYRRQSLKNVYEACEKYINQIDNGADLQLVSKNFKRDIESYFTVNNESHKLLYLLENPSDIWKVFELFYVYIDNKKTETIKDIEQIQQLKNMLMRMLEESPNNISINLTSGLVRFLLDEFEDADGKHRFERALVQISKLKDLKTQQIILINILKICQNIQADRRKVHLAKVLLKYFDKNKYIIPINKFLNDSYTNYLLINYANKSLNGIIENILRG